MLNTLGQNLKQLWESLGPEGCCDRLCDLLKSGTVRAEDFSFRELAESFCGHEWVRRLDPRGPGMRRGHRHIREAGDAVDVTAFSHITGQLFYAKIHQGWDAAPAVCDAIFETVVTALDGERVPGVGSISGSGSSIRPGMPYPEEGFSEHYWDTPATDKQGLIVSLTKEAIFFDRTGLVLRRAGMTGQRLRMRKERKQLAVVAGISVTLGGGVTFDGNNHKWKGTTYNTYATAANAIGINSKASTPLVDWTSVEQSELLFADLLDPDTGEPIDAMPDTLLVMPSKEQTARRILSATEIATTYPGTATTGVTAPGNVRTSSTNPYNGRYQVLVSRLLYKLIKDSGVSEANAKDWWFNLAAKRAFWYMENWPLTVVDAPPNSEAEFERDIVFRQKASERGVPYSAEPRAATKMYNA